MQSRMILCRDTQKEEKKKYIEEVNIFQKCTKNLSKGPKEHPKVMVFSWISRKSESSQSEIQSGMSPQLRFGNLEQP